MILCRSLVNDIRDCVGATLFHLSYTFQLRRSECALVLYRVARVFVTIVVVDCRWRICLAGVVVLVVGGIWRGYTLHHIAAIPLSGLLWLRSVIVDGVVALSCDIVFFDISRDSGAILKQSQSSLVEGCDLCC